MNASKKGEIPQTLVKLARAEDLYQGSALRAAKARFETLIRALESVFPAEPAHERTELKFYSSPGRTELGGNHTDHNHGRVLAAAIDLDSIAVVRPRGDTVARVHSIGFGDFELDLSDCAFRENEMGESIALARGLAASISGKAEFSIAGLPNASRAGARKLRGFDAAIQSDVAPGSGLSSSASFEVLVAAVIADLAGLDVPPAELARAGQFAENEYFGKPCGLMDQMACALGSIVAIDFADPLSPTTQSVAYDFNSRGVDLFIVNTGGSHADLTEDYASIPAEMRCAAGFFGKKSLRGVSKADLVSGANEIRKACGDRAFLRAWHFVGENERASRMKDALENDDFTEYLSLVRKSGDSSWKYLQNLFSARYPERQGLGCALAIAEKFTEDGGACRVHGGGFAGTIQAYVPEKASADFCRVMSGIFGEKSIIPLRIRPFGVVCIQSI